MSEYSFRTEIVWPDVPPLPPERERELARWVEAQIKAEMDRLCNVPLAPPRAAPINPACRCGPVLHNPNCPLGFTS